MVVDERLKLLMKDLNNLEIDGEQNKVETGKIDIRVKLEMNAT